MSKLFLLLLACISPLAVCAATTSSNYIVVFKDSTSIEKRNEHHEWLNEIIKRDGNNNGLSGHLNLGNMAGYHGEFTNQQLEEIRQDESVAFVEPDSYDEIQSLVYLQSETPWGLNRISHLENQYGKNSDYVFKNEGGKGSTVYVLDTGVRMDHKEFKGRIRWGANFANNVDTDENGHGTHVAGVSAGYSVGVSKFANIVAVKILDAHQRGTLSNFIRAMAWIIKDHAALGEGRSVINYSAVGEISQARNLAINEAVKNGIVFVGAAGNKRADACQYGPPSNSQNSPGQIIVAALNYTDQPASFSNYGGCVDVYAPGVNIRSSINLAPNSYGTMSGTSMASPHVAGLVAYYWSLNHSYTQADILKLIADYNMNRVMDNNSGTPNKIAYNNA